MNALAKTPSTQYQISSAEHMQAVRTALKTSLYPGASDESVDLVLAYCTAAGLDPMQKPVHIVPMWDSKSSSMRDVVMPGIGLYRIQASRSGEWAGVTKPEFGPMLTENIGGIQVSYPEWCQVTAKRLMKNGTIAEFTATEYWIENYAVRGGKEKSVAPNAMWLKRTRGQIAKCAQGQSLRLAFPEVGSQPTAEEMEGKTIEGDFVTVSQSQNVAMPNEKPVLLANSAITESENETAKESGIFLDASPKVMLLKKGVSAGFNEEELIEKYKRIDFTNLNTVLSELRIIAENNDK